MDNILFRLFEVVADVFFQMHSLIAKALLCKNLYVSILCDAWKESLTGLKS